MSEKDPFAEEFDALSYVLREKGLLQFPPIEAAELGVLPLRNTLVFPGVILPISVGRPSSLALLEELRQSRFPYLIVVAQKRPQHRGSAPRQSLHHWLDCPDSAHPA
jgi:hypothetical protein